MSDPLDELTDRSTFREVAIRLEGKIDALSAKIDGKFDAILAKVEAGDRESMQMFKLQESELGHIAETVRSNTTRIAQVQVEIERRALAADLETLRRDTSDYPVVRKLVYGVVGLILIGVVTALLSGVVVP